MSESAPRLTSNEKRTIPIVSSRRVRRPGRKRQLGLALFAVLVVAGIVAGGYMWFAPKNDTITIAGYSIASVTQRTLQNSVELGGTVTARRNATVTAPEQGVVARLHASEGEWVTAGQLLAELDSDALRNSIASLERSLERSARDYGRFLLQHEYSVSRQDRQARNLMQTREDALAKVREVEELTAIGSAPLAELRDAERRLSEAIRAIDNHEADVAEAMALHALTRQNYEDDIAFTREELATLQGRLAATRVTAPLTGRVVAVSAAARTSGEQLSQNQTILQIADTRDPVVQTQIEEQYVSRIEIGGAVAVEIAGRRMQGTIERIGQLAAAPSDGGAPVVEIDVRIDLDGGEILPGSSALVEVLVGEVQGALVLPRGPYLTTGNRRYLYRVDGDSATRVEVEYGTITSSWVQIVSGVEAGDRVITSSYSGYIDQQTVILGGNR
jgi:HlyD family secretion protein